MKRLLNDLGQKSMLAGIAVVLLTHLAATALGLLFIFYPYVVTMDADGYRAYIITCAVYYFIVTVISIAAGSFVANKMKGGNHPLYDCLTHDYRSRLNLNRYQ